MKLTFDISWNASSPSGLEPADATRGRLTVRLGTKTIWGVDSDAGTYGIEWTWIDFLEHLARVWPALLWQPYPLGLAPESPIDFPSQARGKLLALNAQPVLDDREMEVWSFTEAHELSHALGGLTLPPLWLVPEGNVAQVAGGAGPSVRSRVSKAESVDQVETFCNEIADRLDKGHPRAAAALEAWERRRGLRKQDSAALYTGLSEEELTEVGFPAFHVKSAFEANEFLAVARATRGFVSTTDRRRLMMAIAKAKLTTSPELDQLASDVRAAPPMGRPHEQGYELARQLRSQLEIPAGRLDPETLLKRWSVAVRTIDLSTEAIDAVCAWGPTHGPIVLLNARGRHAQTRGGRNATLAHEICHLLVDRKEALPLAEAAGGHISEDLEARARAFAAELLAPRSAILEIWNNSSGVENAVSRLKSSFAISAELAAWQIRNANVPLSNKELMLLRARVSRPADY